MMITINGKSYKAAPITFNTVCELEDRGVTLGDLENKQMSAVRAYAAVSMGVDAATAGYELEQHVIGGGNFSELITALSEEVMKSDFFRAAAAKSRQPKAPETEAPSVDDQTGKDD